MTPEDDRPHVGRGRIVVWIILGIVGVALIGAGLITVLTGGG